MMESQCTTKYVDVGCKKFQKVLTILRGGTAELKVEAGRWIGLKGRRGSARSVQVNGKVEHEMHSVLHQRRGQNWSV